MKIKINETEYFINARNHKQIIKYADRICPMQEDEKMLKNTGISNILLNLLLDESDNIRNAIADFIEASTRVIATKKPPTREAIENTVNAMNTEEFLKWRLFVYKSIDNQKAYAAQRVKLFAALASTSERDKGSLQYVKQILATKKKLEQQL